MGEWERLDERDRDEATALLAERPERNAVLLHNIARIGMGEGGSPLHGRYFGRRRDGRLRALGAVYGLGSLFFHEPDPQGLEGLADHLVEHDLRPSFASGPGDAMRGLLDRYLPRSGRRATRIECVLMVLRGGVPPGFDRRGSRPSTLADRGSLVELGVELETELFGRSVGPDALRHLLTVQLEAGGGELVEADGCIVAKAEATMVPGAAAWLGGVFVRRDRRGRGHARACVGALCERMLAAAGPVALVAERDNPASQALYRGLGFRPEDPWLVASFGS
jgi:uncharacterized protein